MTFSAKEDWLSWIFNESKNDWVSLEGTIDEALTPISEDIMLFSSMGEKRRKEFLTGRELVQQAFAKLHYPQQDLAVGENSEPLWPDGVTGSITHHKGHVWVVVSTRPMLIGIDLEATSRLKQPVWPKILTPKELNWIHALPPLEQLPCATLIFSAKEAYFKMQFPKTQEKLGFLEGYIEVTQIHPTLLEGKACYGEWEIIVPKAKLSRAKGYFWMDSQKTYTIAIG